jgi:hypothetical protein
MKFITEAFKEELSLFERLVEGNLNDSSRRSTTVASAFYHNLKAL